MTMDENRTPGDPGTPGAGFPEHRKPVDPGDVLRARIVAALKTCYDPEIPIDIYELGLIYNVDIKPSGAVELTMTLTSPHCPVAESLPGDVERKVAAVEGVASVTVAVTWDPSWNPEMMSEAARLELNF